MLLSKSNITLWLISATMLIGLPLLGLVSGKAEILSYLEFPPLTRYVAHAPFNLTAFVVIAAVDAAMLLGIIMLIKKSFQKCRSMPPNKPNRWRFPVWGIWGAAIMMVGWVLAWTRFQWFTPLQAHTFSIPWLGYILLVNALTVVRSGNSLMTQRPFYFLLLWPTSAIFWWFFEYLNRFVQNWYYVGVNDFSSIEYVFHASLAFSTVLPAVLSTYRLLLTFRVFDAGLKHLTTLDAIDNKHTAWVILIISATALSLIGRFPDYLYPLVWGAPLFIFTSLQTLMGKKNIFTGLRQGDWRVVITSATAALICGFFWELWNYHSQARWEYAIPFVDRFRIFAMPLLGYGGYLPFGLECMLVGHFVLGRHLLISPDMNHLPPREQNPESPSR